jgi:hypothetical protein
VVIAGVGGATLCALGTEGIEAAKCVKAAAGPVIAGAFAIWGAVTGE